ncbi:MAG: SctK family type III secretion system sorting platform protein [Puniceicoccales bacterium]|jgi:hypothetical protein|nr:SctK family type III secretion system sorting platform protein [Puniceicoccales bacterium]
MVEVAESLKKIVASDFEYFKRWYNFNFNVEKYLCKMKLEQVFGAYSSGVFSILLQSDSSKTTVRQSLLSMLGLSGSVDYDIGSPVVRLAIGGKDILERAMVTSGAIFCHRDIAKIISKRELTVLTEFIGRDTYAFIVKRGMILWKMTPDLSAESGGTVVEKIRTIGKKILCMALFGLPGEVKKRLELMFDCEFNIPDRCDEMLAKKCFDLMNFSLERLNYGNGRC